MKILYGCISARICTYCMLLCCWLVWVGEIWEGVVKWINTWVIEHVYIAARIQVQCLLRILDLLPPFKAYALPLMTVLKRFTPFLLTHSSPQFPLPLRHWTIRISAWLWFSYCRLCVWDSSAFFFDAETPNASPPTLPLLSHLLPLHVLSATVAAHHRCYSASAPAASYAALADAAAPAASSHTSAAAVAFAVLVVDAAAASAPPLLLLLTPQLPLRMLPPPLLLMSLLLMPTQLRLCHTRWLSITS